MTRIHSLSHALTQAAFIEPEIPKFPPGCADSRIRASPLRVHLSSVCAVGISSLGHTICLPTRQCSVTAEPLLNHSPTFHCFIYPEICSLTTSLHHSFFPSVTVYLATHSTHIHDMCSMCQAQGAPRRVRDVCVPPPRPSIRQGKPGACVICWTGTAPTLHYTATDLDYGPSKQLSAVWTPNTCIPCSNHDSTISPVKVTARAVTRRTTDLAPKLPGPMPHSG